MTRLTRPLLLALLALAALAVTGDAAARPATPSAAAQEIEDFVPTETIGADQAVAFPTDI